LDQWEKGDLDDLLHEGVTIQNNLTSSSNGAIKLLSRNIQNGILPLNDETLELLKQKHPKEKNPCSDILLDDTPIRIHPIRFEEIDAEMIRQSSLKTKGGAGPSGMDGDGWRRILSSNSFGVESSDLCTALAKLTRLLCTDVQQNDSLEPLLASRLIPLNKNPGLRPIGIGETLRRIIGKSVARALKQEVTNSVGSLQALR